MSGNEEAVDRLISLIRGTENLMYQWDHIVEHGLGDSVDHGALLGQFEALLAGRDADQLEADVMRLAMQSPAVTLPSQAPAWLVDLAGRIERLEVTVKNNCEVDTAEFKRVKAQLAAFSERIETHTHTQETWVDAYGIYDEKETSTPNPP